MIKELLMQSKWRVFNVSIAKAIGLHETLVLMEIADAEQAFEGNEFFLTYEKISDNTTLSEKQIRNAVRNLKELGIIETKMKGQPAKQYFYITGLDKLSGGRARPTKKGRSKPIQKETPNPYEMDRAIYKEPINKEPSYKEPNTFPKNEFSGDDDSEPIIEKKKKKNSAAKKKKKTDPLFQPFRKLFEAEYTRLTGTVYYWQVKDSVAINRLIQKVRYAYKTAKKPVENPTSEQMTNGFAHILKRAANDKWLSRNFETTLIDSKFNNLKNLRNGTQTEKDRELFQGVIDGYLNKD